MKRRVLAPASGMTVLALLVLSAAQAAGADTFVGGTGVWTMVGTPSFHTSFGNPAGVVAFSNNIGVTVTGIVIMVLRNTSGQTAYYSTATLTLASGQISSAALVEFGLAPATYNATFFAFTFGGVAISPSTSVPFQVTR